MDFDLLSAAISESGIESEVKHTLAPVSIFSNGMQAQLTTPIKQNLLPSNYAVRSPLFHHSQSLVNDPQASSRILTMPDGRQLTISTASTPLNGKRVTGIRSPLPNNHGYLNASPHSLQNTPHSEDGLPQRPANSPFPFMQAPHLPNKVRGNHYPTPRTQYEASLPQSSQIIFDPDDPEKKSSRTFEHHSYASTKLIAKNQQYAEISNNYLQPVEEGVDEEDAMTHAETFANYQPSKLKIGVIHPDPIVETTSMSSVQPPDIRYSFALPEEVIDAGLLSSLQLESVCYASQRHEVILENGERAGFLIGDGAGVGKGRTIAGIIYENYALGRKKALWISVSNDLKYDAARDLKDIGASHIAVHSLNKFKYAKISSKENGSVKKGVIFSTYASLISETTRNKKFRTRLKQLVHWFGDDFDGVLVFDECHRAKNLVPTGSTKPTKTGQTVLELQKRLPKARVIYASATGASEPKNMAYMTRLGLWGPGTPFREFQDFIRAVERRGVGAMEIVAMDMKLRGMYLARQLSFTDVQFRVEEVPLNEAFVAMYNKSVDLWEMARDYFAKAAVFVTDGENKLSKMMWGQFWSSHQRFFKFLCIASKVDYVVKLARDAVKNGRCVVIGLQSTGEARTIEQVESLGGDLDDFVSTAKGVFQSLVERHFPASDQLRIPTLATEVNQESQTKRKILNPLRKDGKKRRLEHNNVDFSNSDSEMESSEGEKPNGFQNSSDEDEGNPFGSSNEDDPWLRKETEVKKSKQKNKKKIDKVKRRRHDSSEFSSDSEMIDSYAAKCNFAQKSFMNDQFLNNRNLPASASEKCRQMKQELLDALNDLETSLPPNTLDQLIDELGGIENVAEMTGRKGRVVSTDSGSVQYEKRSEADVPLEIINLTEKKRFMDGEKNIAIISEAASSGISLQADRRAKNQRRRVHITLELPWSADRAIQQFGRTHRSNQISAPQYVLCISSLAGERRFASIVAKRLECLGALTHGDRRATETQNLSEFNFDNKYGRLALETVLFSIAYGDPGKVKPPSYYKGSFFKDLKLALTSVGLCDYSEHGGYNLEKDANSITKFLNRILGMRVAQQNALFDYFTQTLDEIIKEEKRNGRFDMGILDLGKSGETVTKRKLKTFTNEFNSGTCALHEIVVEKGISWDEAINQWQLLDSETEGFYKDKNHSSLRKKVILLSSIKIGKKKMYSITRPNIGTLSKYETLETIKETMTRITCEDAKKDWEEIYFQSATNCTHVIFNGSCRRIAMGLECDAGKRKRQLYVLSGSVLGVWNKVECVLSAVSNAKMQVIRLKTIDNQKIVGLLIPNTAFQKLSDVLSDGKVTYDGDVVLPSLSSPQLPSMNKLKSQHPVQINDGSTPPRIAFPSNNLPQNRLPGNYLTPGEVNTNHPAKPLVPFARAFNSPNSSHVVSGSITKLSSSAIQVDDYNSRSFNNIKCEPVPNSPVRRQPSPPALVPPPEPPKAIGNNPEFTYQDSLDSSNSNKIAFSTGNSELFSSVDIPDFSVSSTTDSDLVTSGSNSDFLLMDSIF